jgi:tRNA pseudouridine38-40 synthase
VARSYLYQIARRRTALAKPFVWWVKDALDAQAMAAAGAALRGAARLPVLHRPGPGGRIDEVKVESVEVREEGALILIRILGSHFLWKMVRRHDRRAGRGRTGALDESDITHFLSGPSEAVAPLTAPPSGLFLERVLYEGDPGRARARGAVALTAGPSR